MRTPEGDQLLEVIRSLIHGRVPPGQEETTVEIVTRTVVLIMSDPQYYSHLRLVIDLQSRIMQLERALAIVQNQQRPVMVVAKKAAVKKKAAAKKMAAPRKVSKKPLPSNVKQFRRGASGR